MQVVSWEVLAEQLPDFNLDDVQMLIGDNLKLYLDMLSQFHRDCSEDGVEIIYQLGIGKTTEAEKILHRLKGVSGNLGIVVLQQASEALDGQLKLGKYSEQAFDAWQTQLINTVSRINALGCTVVDVSRERHSDSTQTFVSLLTEMDQKLGRGAFVDEWEIKALQPYIQPSEMELFGRLVKYITTHDYPKAKSTLKTLTYVANASE